MMKESYVSFKTAKLLEEVGFDEYCKKFYDHNGLLWGLKGVPSMLKGWYPCPTLELVQKWLRETKGIDVLVYIDFELLEIKSGKSRYSVQVLEGVNCFGEMHSFDCYEDALESGVQGYLKQYHNERDTDKI